METGAVAAQATMGAAVVQEPAGSEVFSSKVVRAEDLVPVNGRHGNNRSRSHARPGRVASRDRDAAVRHRVGASGAFRPYQLLLVAIDATAAITGTALAWVSRFGIAGSGPAVDVVFAAVLPAAWLIAIVANKAYQRRFVGVGAAEFDRVLRAFLHLAVAATFMLYVFDASVARGFALPAFGFVLLLDLLGRYGARKALHHRRRAGKSMTSVIAVGDAASLIEFVGLLRRDKHAGLNVVGACLPSKAPRNGVAERALAEQGITVLGTTDSIRSIVESARAHTVAVLSGQISPEKLRWISWQLEGTETDLVVSPGLAAIGGGRLHVQPVAGLPLLHIETPSFAGFGRMIKVGFDRAIAAVALVVAAPALLLIATLIKLDSPGPALFVQTRVGRHGREFPMIKFRSMVMDAELRLAELREANESDGLLFKMRADPRVTRIGRLLRRYSLDELPQIFNVLAGSMSLVGPRPPLPSEVAAYGDDVRRRLLVKPGLTGLWQVSGRSNLTWEESVQLDLRYIEDWSLSLDMAVLWKTARAVVRSDGAY